MNGVEVVPKEEIDLGISEQCNCNKCPYRDYVIEDLKRHHDLIIKLDIQLLQRKEA